MSVAPVIAVDTETTGLDPVLDEIWEFAAIRREPSGIEHEMHLFVEHEWARCSQLPESFLTDHKKRWPAPHDATPRGDAAFLIDTFIRGPEGSERAHIIGAVPNFDTERLARLLRNHSPNPTRYRDPWHHHLVDVENLAVGWLRGQFPGLALDPPWDSDLLSEAVGVVVPTEERHTALGDARWALRIFDRIMQVER